MKIKTLILATLALCLSLTANATNPLDNPNGLAFDSIGNLWVANYVSNTVVALNPTSGALLSTISEGLNGPTRLFFASSDVLYVLNTGGNNITVYNTQTLKLLNTISNSNFNKPLGFALDVYGDLYVSNVASSADNVIALNINGSLVETLTKDDSGYVFTAPGTIVIHGQDLYLSIGPNMGPNAVISYNVGEFLTHNPIEKVVYNDNVNDGPTGITFDSKENVYISEFTSNTAIVYNSSGKKILLVINPSGATTLFNGPEGIALDSSGNIYISSSYDNKIAVFSGLNSSSPGQLLYDLE
jgi:sugar lactone lactonase YvrE